MDLNSQITSRFLLFWSSNSCLPSHKSRHNAEHLDNESQSPMEVDTCPHSNKSYRRHCGKNGDVTEESNSRPSWLTSDTCETCKKMLRDGVSDQSSLNESSSSIRWDVDFSQLPDHEFSISNSARHFSAMHFLGEQLCHRLRVKVSGSLKFCIRFSTQDRRKLPHSMTQVGHADSFHMFNFEQNILSVRWNEAFISMMARMFSSPVIVRKGLIVLPEAIAGNMYRGIPECLLLVLASELRECSQVSGDWSLITRDIRIFGGMVSSSQICSRSVINHPTPFFSWIFHHFTPAPPPWTLSDAAQTFFSSLRFSSNSDGRNITFSQLCQASSMSSLEAALQTVSVLQRQEVIWSALLIHSLNDDTLEDSSISRLFADGIEGLSRLVPEEFLIFEQSAFYHVADMHDQYRDMRLDVDNMSYEELLALEDQIGSVSTGLSEESVTKCLKHTKYTLGMESKALEPCSICQEEFAEDDDVGMLDCGHGFHIACIMQWLSHKNVCPFCKSTALNTTDAPS